MTARRKPQVEIPVERGKAAQAAGKFGLEDLPGPLATPDAAVRLGRQASKDTVLLGVESLKELCRLGPGQLLANYGRAESQWATSYWKRRAGEAEFTDLLSYSRQIIGLDADGTVEICLMGHAGQGACIPLWVPREDVALTVQPNDVVLRFDDTPFDL